LDRLNARSFLAKVRTSTTALEVIEQMNMLRSPQLYGVRPRKDHRGVDLINVHS
jgi:hypothetical protein